MAPQSEGTVSMGVGYMGCAVRPGDGGACGRGAEEALEVPGMRVFPLEGTTP